MTPRILPLTPALAAAALAALLALQPHNLRAQPAPVPVKGGLAHPTRIIARYAEGAAPAARLQALAAAGVEVRHPLPGVPGLVVLALPDGPQPAAADPAAQAARLQERMARLRASGVFLYVEPDYIRSLRSVPGDAGFTDGTLWGLRNTGQSDGVSGADIDAVRAWQLTTGSTNVIVAVIDTGIRHTHRDLAAQMWRNPGEIPANGVDDDQDGYVDNVFGINAITGSGDPWDDNDHGTHCAGTIGAAADDGHPHVGVAWQVRLMACKFLDGDGSGATSDAIRCINFAVAKGARILNNSWGGGGFSQGLFDAIAAARDQGVLFVAAAGNESQDTDTEPSYPANYDLENVLSVAALDRQDKLASFSNYGAETVDLGAPGVAIYSSAAGSDQDYKTFNGTSMATPHVAGVAALLLARFPDLTVPVLRQRLLGTTVPVADLRGRSVTGGRVNAFQALSATPDGFLEVSVGVPGGEAVGGRTASLHVRVTDLFSVTNATIAATSPGLPPLSFRNDGVAPDTTALDGTYTAAFTVPTVGTQLVVTTVVTAPGKVAATNTSAFAIVLRPPNDLLADASPLAGATAEATGSNRAGTKEPGEPAHAGNAGGRSIWWTWTAPAAGTVTVSTDGSGFDTILAVYTGGGVASLIPVAADDDSGEGLNSRVSFNAAAGSTYRIAVDGFGGASGAVRLALRAGGGQAGPANDHFAARAPLAGRTASADAVSFGATREPGEPAHAGNPGGRSLWWTWTAPADGQVVIRTDGSDFNTLLAVYTGGSLTALTVVAADDDGGEGSRSLVSFLAGAGRTYQIAVDGYSGAAGNVTLTLAQSEATPAPPNDAFAGRRALSGRNPVASGTNVGASKEAGEPDHAENSGGRSVWWTWTPPDDGEVVIETTGSGFDTLLAVYAGETVDGLALVAENDDDPAGGTASRVGFFGTAGITYQIAVDGGNRGFGAASGDIILTIRVAGQGGTLNDDFAARRTLEGTDARAEGSNVGATLEPAEPDHAGLPGGASVWWTWTAPADLAVTLDTAGSGFDTVLAVYTGGSLGGLLPLAANDDGPLDRTSVVRFNARAGTTYQIAVDGFLGAAGPISLRLAGVPRQAVPPNDLFAGRIAVPAGTGVTGTNDGASREPGEPLHAGNAGGSSVWWSWTAPADGRTTVTTAGSGLDTVLGVYTGGAVTALGLVGDNDDDGPSLQSRVVFAAVAGRQYQIAVDGYGGAQGAIRLAVSQDTAPPNDDLEAATAIAGARRILQGRNGGASRQPGEPAHYGYTAARSVWWSWTAPAAGNVMISTEGSDFDTVLAVYTGAGLGTLSLVAEDDDGGMDATSRAFFAAAAGETYRIAVDGYAGEQGRIVLNVNLGGEGPPNDAFQDAELLLGRSQDVRAVNFDATGQAGEPPHAGEAASRSVWWRWTAPASAPVTIATHGSDFDTVLAVYTGGSLPGLSRIAESDDAGGGLTSAVTFAAVAGREYRIAVGGFAGEQGRIQLALDQEATAETPPRLTGHGMTMAGFRLTAAVQPGRTYQLLATDDLGQWVLVTQFTSPVAEFSHVDPVVPGRGSRFYRIVGP
jgi:subtilisin family serine protease